jgi:putative membrane protein
MTRTTWALTTLLATVLAAASVRAPYPEEMYLQHSPTIVLLIALPLLSRRWPLSDRAFACLVAFLMLHTLGARYIYSNVPYDRWAAAFLGHDLSSTFGWQRNHYDRLVHFSFGLLWALPVYEVSVRYLGIPRRVAYYTVVEFLLAFSALYELFEWGLTMVLSPQDASEYNGQQGDIWDAHKDVSLALIGAMLSTAALLVTRPAAGRAVTPNPSLQRTPPGRSPGWRR